MLTDMNSREVTLETFRDAMAQLGAAVHVITTDGPAGRAGFTASAVCSITDTPPSVLVCINRTSSAYHAVTTNARLCINTLSADQHDVSAGFAKKGSMDQRFRHGKWIERAGKPPHLVEASASIDCAVINRVQVGTHDILICEVSEIVSNSHPGVLIYYDRKYHRIMRG
jgi:flavin reductase